MGLRVCEDCMSGILKTINRCMYACSPRQKARFRKENFWVMRCVKASENVTFLAANVKETCLISRFDSEFCDTIPIFSGGFDIFVSSSIKRR